MLSGRYWLMSCVLFAGIIMGNRRSIAQEGRRSDWYRDSIVNLHIDNHSSLVGKGYSAEQLKEMVKDIPVSMIQVSAFGAVGITTYPTAICPHADLGDWDTLAVWGQVARDLKKPFGVYINTRGLGLFKQHPEWVQRDARGKGKGKNGGLDVCARPSADGSGVLETVFLPMLNEIVTRYEPDGIWVDGDHARTPVCYCNNCKAAWKAQTGNPEPPVKPDDPDWPKWLALEQRRYDEYRQKMADAIHSVRSSCMYTSNHSWRFSSRDPRCAPAFVGTLSGDLSHGLALRLTRLSWMQLSAEEAVPYDIMHNIRSINRKDISMRRILQQGAITFASGGSWFLWVPGSTIVQKPVQERAKLCAEFAMARREALGRSSSLNQTAVLLSETSWHRERIGGEEGYYDPTAPEHAALALQDACYAVDIVNEEILLSQIGRYRTVIVANQRSVEQEVLSLLRKFVEEGGVLIVAGSGLREEPGQENPAVSELLGLTRTQEIQQSHVIDLEGEFSTFRSAWGIQVRDAEVVARFENGSPALSRRRLGQGTTAYLAVSEIPYPDDAGVWPWVMKALGNGPAVHVEGDARDAHLVFSLRHKPGHVILHVADLTSRVKGRRIIPAMQNDIDESPPLPEVQLSLRLSSPPKRVQAVPNETTVSHRWENGILHLTLKNLDVHAAIILDVEPETPMAYMSAATPMAERHVVNLSFTEDFESIGVREPFPEGIGDCRAEGKTSIRVTAKTAASGRHSLKFADHPDAPQPFHPYFTIKPVGLNRDIGYFSFDLKLQEEAQAQVELREVENAREFPVGPSLRFTGKDELIAAGRPSPIADIPRDEWFHVDILFPLDGSGHYELRMRVPGEEERVFPDLPYRSPDFRRCGWIGIIGAGTAEAAFYVDNLRIGRVKKVAEFENLQEQIRIEKKDTVSAEFVKEEGLAAFWNFDEGEGDTATDLSGNENTGEVAARWVKGDFGYALHFGGEAGSNVAVEDCEGMRFSRSDFTIECWVGPQNLDSPKKFRRLLEKNAYPGTWWNVDILSDGRVEMEMADENKNTGTTVSDGALPVGSWTHLAITIDRKNMETRYYLNGKRDSAKKIPDSFTGSLDVKGKDLYIGGGHLPFIGLIDELKIYRRALTEEEIRTNYEKGKNRRSNFTYTPVGRPAEIPTKG